MDPSLGKSAYHHLNLNYVHLVCIPGSDQYIDHCIFYLHLLLRNSEFNLETAFACEAWFCEIPPHTHTLLPTWEPVYFLDILELTVLFAGAVLFDDTDVLDAILGCTLEVTFFEPAETRFFLLGELVGASEERRGYKRREGDDGSDCTWLHEKASRQWGGRCIRGEKRRG